MVLLWLLGRGRLGRSVFLAIGSLVVLRYLYWRATSTLPPIVRPARFRPRRRPGRRPRSIAC